MRLIDADAFDKMLIEAQAKCKKDGGNFRLGVLGNVRANLALFPAVDRPEIVRCKECKYRGEWERAEDIHGSYSRIVFPDGSLCPGQCEDQFYSWLPPDDWFCANGKQRE